MKTKHIQTMSLFVLLFSTGLSFMTTPLKAEVPNSGNNNINGTVYYKNPVPSGIPGSTVVLLNSSGLVVATTLTNTEGHYSFNTIADGVYSLALQPSIPWGGTNATDAYLILQHFVQATQLDGLNYAAADVFPGNIVNSKDALATARRFVGLDNSFPKGDFVNDVNGVITVSGGQTVTRDIRILALGDVNASYDFSGLLRTPAGAELLPESEIAIRQGTKAEINLSTAASIAVSAISLSFEYPAEKFEIESVRPATETGLFTWKAENGLVRIAWFNAEAIDFNAGASLVHFQIKALGKGLINTPFTATPETEIAGRSGEALPAPALLIPKIRMEKNSPEETLSIFPNPVKSFGEISYFSEIEGPATLKISNLLGETLLLKPVELISGKNQFRIQTEDFPRGLYLVDIQYQGQKLASRKLTKN